MILPDKKMNTYTRSVSEFKGLNRLPVNSEGELNESNNIIFDLYPAMSVRKGRTTYATVAGTPQALISAQNKLAWISGNTLYYDGNSTGLTGLSSGQKSAVEFWGKIFIFPDAKYYDIATGTYGSIGTGTYPTDATSCPAMDYICVHNNRIWGVKGNYIYASSNGYALGAAGSDGRHGWVQFYNAKGDVDDSGSFYQEVASDGDFTGIISWDNRIVALKERCHHEIQGSYPSNFALSTVSKFGTINHFSMQEVNSKLMYTSSNGVLLYAGGLESDTSRKLNETFSNAVSGTDGIRYYLCLNNGTSKKMYVYNSLISMWTEEDSLDVVCFCQHQGKLYALCSDGKIIILNDPASTESVKWDFIFSDYADTVYYDSVPSKMIIKARGTSGSSMSVKMSVDGSEYESLGTSNFLNGIMQTIKLGVKRGKEHLFKVEGTGNVEIYGYQYVNRNGGENIV